MLCTSHSPEVMTSFFLPWDSNKFIYQSQCDGYNHLYLYDLEQLHAIQPQKLTKGEAEKLWKTIEGAHVRRRPPVEERPAAQQGR